MKHTKTSVKIGRPALALDDPENVAVMQLLADGYRLVDISVLRNITNQATSSRIRNLKIKTQCKTTCQLVAHYVRNGWID